MNQKSWAIFACIGAVSGQAIAAASDPADVNAVIPATIYKSPFADYRPLGEDKDTPWRDANETVGKIGGWRAYAREAAEAMKARETVNTKKPPDIDSTKAKPAASPPVVVPPPAQIHKHGG